MPKTVEKSTGYNFGSYVSQSSTFSRQSDRTLDTDNKALIVLAFVGIHSNS
ncbi:MAG TPA: hypothetical protein V6D48_20835 [Oculatellaceae cyanobacterium]